MSKIKVCWISNAPSPYKMAFWRYFAQFVDLTCVFETKAENDREKSWYDYNSSGFHAIFLNHKDDKKIVRKLAKENDCLIDSDYTKRICIYATKIFHEAEKPTFLYADGGLVIPRGLFDKIISYFMKKHDYFFSSGKKTNEYFYYYGIPSDKIKNYHFACMSQDEIHKNMSNFKKRDHHEIRLLSVGQQIPRKGYDVLCRAMIGIPKYVKLDIIGGNPEPNVKKIVQENHLDNINFIPFLSKDELSKYYQEADVFVFPTRYDIWGLVINEAMSYRLPIIATDRCVSAIDLCQNKGNSIIVSAENIEELNQAIFEFISKKEEWGKMGEISAQIIEDYSYEVMAEDIFSVLKKVVSVWKG